MSDPNKTYTRSELEEAMKNVATATAELTKTTIIEELNEKGLLKEDTPPGTTKKFLAGLLHKGTKHISSFAKDVIAEGETVLVQSAIKSIDEKAEAREREEFDKMMKSKYNK